jgi:hypothetical protein
MQPNMGEMSDVTGVITGESQRAAGGFALLEVPDIFQDIVTYLFFVVVATVGYVFAWLLKRQTAKTQKSGDMDTQMATMPPGLGADLPTDVMSRVRKARGGSLGSRSAAWKREALAFAQLIPLMIDGILPRSDCIGEHHSSTKQGQLPKEKQQDSAPIGSEKRHARSKKRTQDSQKNADSVQAKAVGCMRMQPLHASRPQPVKPSKTLAVEQQNPLCKKKVHEVIRSVEGSKELLHERPHPTLEAECCHQAEEFTVVGTQRGRKAGKGQRQCSQPETTSNKMACEEAKDSILVEDGRNFSIEKPPLVEIAGTASMVAAAELSGLHMPCKDVATNLSNVLRDQSAACEVDTTDLAESSAKSSTDEASEVGQEQANLEDEPLSLCKEWDSQVVSFQVESVTHFDGAPRSESPAEALQFFPYDYQGMQTTEGPDPTDAFSQAQFLYADPAECSMGEYCTDVDGTAAWFPGNSDEFQQWGMALEDMNFQALQGSSTDMDFSMLSEQDWLQWTMGDSEAPVLDSDALWSASFLDCGWSQEAHYCGHGQPFLISAQSCGNGDVCGIHEDEEALPEVVMGTKENEYIGLQLLAEMGDWCALKETREEKGGRPFFWNRCTGERTWQMPQIIKETGLGDLFMKYAEKVTAPSHDFPDRERQIRATRLSAGLDVRDRQDVLERRAIHLARRYALWKQQEEYYATHSDGMQGAASVNSQMERHRRVRLLPDDQRLRHRRGGSTKWVPKVEECQSRPPPPLFTEEAFPALVKATTDAAKNLAQQKSSWTNMLKDKLGL